MSQENTQDTDQFEDAEFDAEGEAEGIPEDLHFSPPEGSEAISTDVSGYWVPTTPLSFKPRGVRLLDNGKESNKSSALVIGELLVPTELKVNSPDKEEQVMKEFPAGTQVGVWAKAGMRDLAKNTNGAHIWMAPNGKRKMKDETKNKMALFMVRRLKGSPPGAALELIEDGRKKSLKEPALADTPPWWLIVLGEDLGKAKAQRILRQELDAATAPS